MTRFDAHQIASLTKLRAQAIRGGSQDSPLNREEQDLLLEFLDDVDEGAVSMNFIDSLVEIVADDEYALSLVGATYIESMLERHPERYSAAIEEMCRRSQVPWRTVLGSVWVQDVDRLGPLTASFLPHALPPEDKVQPSSSRKATKTRRSRTLPKTRRRG